MQFVFSCFRSGFPFHQVLSRFHRALIFKKDPVDLFRYGHGYTGYFRELTGGFCRPYPFDHHLYFGYCLLYGPAPGNLFPEVPVPAVGTYAGDYQVPHARQARKSHFLCPHFCPEPHYFKSSPRNQGGFRIVAQPQPVAHAGCYGDYIFEGATHFDARDVGVGVEPEKRRCEQFLDGFCNGFVFGCDNDGRGHLYAHFFGVGWTREDRYPFMNPSGWEAPVNQPPTISSLNQYKSDGETEIPEGGITTESSPDNPYNSLVVFKANLNDSDNDNVKLQVELKEFNQPFDGTGLIESDFLPSGSTATITRYGIVEGKYHWRARGVDDKGNTSDWQEFGAIGNVDFQVKLVPLYTQVVSPYPSEALTDSWDHLPYAHADPEKGIRYNCGFTIATCGCAITSIVMIARYYDVLEAYSKDVNPKELNDWLKAEPGGYINGDVNWIVGAKYTNWRIKYERSDTTINNYTLLDQKLNQNQPVIAKQINPSHFIVIDNKLANTYGVKDPSWYNTNKLDESTTNWTSKIRDYNNNFYGLRIYKKGDGITQSAITFALGSPAELLLTDPQGRKLGKDAYGIEYNEVPLGWYFEDGFDDPTGENPLFQERNKLIQILEPIDGIYQLQVIGIREGDYSLAFNSYDTQGNVNHQEFHSETAPGYTAQYNINFDSTNSNNTTIELFDKIPPEAEIYFDPLNQEFVIRGTDNTTVNPTISFIPVDKQQVIYFIQDEVGNTTKLFFEKIKQEGKEIKSELKSIQYNDSEIIEFPKTKLKYEWSLDKKTNQIKELEQKIEVEDQFEIKAKYNHQKDETKIKIKRENEEEIKQTVPGLVIIKLITKSGVLDFKF